MKKILCFLSCLFICPLLWAQNPEINKNNTDDDNAPEKPAKEKFRLKNRTVELSIANISFGFSNDFISASDIINNPVYIIKNFSDIKNDPALIYKDPIEIEIDDLTKGISFNLSGAIKPFSFNFNWKDKWGFGLDIAHIEATGNVTLAGNMLAFKEAEQEKSGAGAAVFVDVGVPIFFHAGDLKIKVRPAVYLPLLYTEPSITYTAKDEMYYNINYNMYIYSPFNMKSLQDGDTAAVTQDMQDNYRNILKNNLGYDFGLSAEYPLNRHLDIGVDFVNIPVPFATAKLNHFLQLQGEAFLDTSKIDIDKIIEDEGNLPENFWDEIAGFTFNDPVTGYNSDGKTIFRPFKMLVYANYRPFDSRILSLVPSLGFSINRLYTRPAAVEGGLGVCLDFANIFITTLGVHYNDRKWKNSIDIALNLRAFELDMGLTFQSQNFIKSWQGAGLGVNFGIKIGW
jgi:hypothetical protein